MFVLQFFNSLYFNILFLFLSGVPAPFCWYKLSFVSVFVFVCFVYIQCITQRLIKMYLCVCEVLICSSVAKLPSWSVKNPFLSRGLCLVCWFVSVCMCSGLIFFLALALLLISFGWNVLFGFSCVKEKKKVDFCVKKEILKEEWNS